MSSSAPAAILDAAGVVRLLGLALHPEGGHYHEIYREGDGSRRAAATAIYYLLAAVERSAWHRVRDAVEIWHWYAGAALALSVCDGVGPAILHRRGNGIAAGERPQAVVPVDAWQSAVSLGAWSLVGCTVSPGFEFASFEMAPSGWSPPG
ncbi:MAG: cupin domain-containing protein [Alphaproteobacteria bacterium]|nr:cupin domain-containing protein [Alphaproteobacteria bacterium]